MIDWGRVAELRAEVGEDGFAEVVALFLEETDEVVARLGSPAANLRHDLHFLKGSALNLGFRQLARLCQLSAPGTQIDLTGLAALYHASKAEFQAALAQLSAA